MENKCKNNFDQGFRYVETTMLGTELMNATLEKPISVMELITEDGNMITNVEFNSFVLDVANIRLTPIQHCFMSVIYTMYTNGVEEFSVNQFANELARRKVKFNKDNMLTGVSAVKMLMKSNAQENIDAIVVNNENQDEINHFTYDEKDRANRNVKNNYTIINETSQSVHPVSENELDLYNSIMYELTKMSLVFVTLDLEKYDIRCLKGRYRELKTSGQLLPLRIKLVEDLNTKEKKVIFKITSVPILYEYAEKAKRIAKIPNKALNVPSNRTVEDEVLTQIIGKKISRLKNRNNRYNAKNITYEYFVYEKDEYTDVSKRVRKGLFKDLGICREQYTTDSAWSKRKSKIHTQVGKILQNFVDTHQIKGYVEIKDGIKIIGYEILT